MPLQPGQTLAHYRLVDKIGEGGMGVVWKAEDQDLGRDVAIKVLPDGFGEDAERLARFQREARLLASLNHPNIAAVYGLHEDAGVRFIAMELVGGIDLARHLQHGPLSLDDALHTSLEIARALEAAHGNGVIHRDLKPANVLRDADGRIKVLDFGLAKTMGRISSSGSMNPSLSPTVTSAGTVAGTLLGTAAYMSPEQARGRSLDRRTDIWSFGCLLYELLTGKKAFGGDSISDALAAILKSEPDWDALPGDTPRAIRRLLRRCLVKDSDGRLHDIADARLEIEEAREAPAGVDEAGSGTVAPTTTAGRILRILPWAVALIAMLVAIHSAMVAPGTPSSSPPPSQVVSSLLPPPEVGFDLTYGLALSPGGKQLVFSGLDRDGTGGLWIRALDRAEARQVAGTDGGLAPFWSPDGHHLGFFTASQLKKIDLQTGVVEDLAAVTATNGGTWGSHGDIVFAQDKDLPLMRVAASGGRPDPVTVLNNAGVDRHAWPSFLPDGRHFVYLIRDYSSEEKTGEAWISSLDGTVSKRLFSSNSSPRYAPPGNLVWWQQGNLRAQRFDLESLSLQGEPTALIAGVRFDPRMASAVFSLSIMGTLVYQQGGALSGNELAWVDRQGNDLGTVGPAGSLYDPMLSPDGTRIAVDISGETNQGDVWVIDVRRNTSSRLTSAQEDESCPVWSPDGTRLAYCSIRGVEHFSIFSRSAASRGEEKLLVKAPATDLSPTDWHDGVILVQSKAGTAADIYIYSVQDEKLTPYLDASFAEGGGSFSPDGRHVSYSSDATGRYEIYVQTFPDPAAGWRVSVEGGSMPRFSPDGSELFFVSPGKEFMVAAITRSQGGEELEFGTPQALFRIDVKQSTTSQWDTADGQRFMFNRQFHAGADDPLTLVQNWASALRP